MLRSEAVKACLAKLDGWLFIACNGFASRELFFWDDHRNFYMLGSMGLATPIGVGISTSIGKKTAVLEGNGNLLMNAASLSTAVKLGATNLAVVLLDNACYESTGGQETNDMNFALLAEASGVKRENVFSCMDINSLESALKKIALAEGNGPFFVWVRTQKEKPKPRVELTPREISERFAEKATQGFY